MDESNLTRAGGSGAQERFHALDGMRGVGAIIVFVFHLGLAPRLVGPHAYLLIDLFFVLSGFVLAHAYEHRMGEQGAFWGFLRERIIRLHPLLVLSAIPGVIGSLMRSPLARDPYPILTAISGLIPFPALWKADLPAFPFPLNGPSWTLFWELLVNIVYALVAPRLSTRMLIAIVAVTGLVLTVTSFFLPIYRDLVYSGLRGIACFPLGLLLFRAHRSGRVRPRAIGKYALPIMVAFSVAPFSLGPVYETLVRYVVIPMIVLGAASHQVRFPAVHAFLGEISYPIYILQIPMWAVVVTATDWLGIGHHRGVAAGVSLILICAVWRFYELPARRWLRRRYGWRRRSAS